MTLYRHVMSGATPGEQWECRMYVSCFLGIADAQTAWTAAVTAMWTGLAAPADNLNQLIPTDVTLDEVTTSQLDPVTFRQTSKVVGSLSLAGTATTAMLPPQCAAGVTWLTALDTKTGRGRNYLPPFAAGTLTAGRIGTASLTIFKLAMTNLLQSLVASSDTPVVFSPTHHTTQVITGGRVGDVFDTQRRRRDKLVPAYDIFAS